MSTSPTPMRRAGIVARWPAGMVLAAWRYLWRTVPVYRSEGAGDSADLPPPASVTGLRGSGASEQLLGWQRGFGPLFHRCYRARLCGSSCTPEELMARLSGDPNRAAPVEVAVFIKLRGAEGLMSVGDEYVVRMPGPWDGPVRVVDCGPISFRFATLPGHLEAGQIQFSATSDPDGVPVFAIESWARAGDRLSELLYARLRVAKEMQLHVWTHYCTKIARLAGGRLSEGIEVSTRWISAEELADVA